MSMTNSFLSAVSIIETHLGLNRMISIMSSVLQSERLKRLELAQSISLSVDDRGSFRIVRYRCGYLSPSDFEQACAGNLFSDQVGCGSGSTDLETLCSSTPLMLEGGCQHH